MIFDTINKAEIFSGCKNEQQFKTAWVHTFSRFYKKMWCIETEETVAGFPDVMTVDSESRIHLFEFKVTDNNGRFKFQPTQPAFYRKNKDIPISIVVLSRKKGKVEKWIHFKPEYLFNGNLLTEKATATVDAVIGYIEFNSLYEDNSTGI